MPGTSTAKARSSPSTRRPTGGRAARVVESVMQATEAEVVEHGYNATSIERIAQRAGVHKTSVYRRWPTKADLLAAFLEHQSLRITPPTPPDTGSLEGDSEIVLRLAHEVLGERFAAFWRAVESEGRHPRVQELKREIWQRRVDFIGEILERAKRRGELDSSLDGGTVVDLFLGAAIVRQIGRDQAVTAAWLDQIWWLIMASGGYDPPASSTRPARHHRAGA